MSDGAANQRILTPEELDDLLENRADGSHVSADEELARRLPRAVPDDATANDNSRDVKRSVEECATAWGRQMASSYQRRIECSLIGWDEFDTTEITAALMESDEVVCFDLRSSAGSTPRPGTGFVLVARPLFAALLELEFGSGSDTKPTVGPLRPYTGIEHRLFARLVRDLLSGLENCWRDWCALRPEITGFATRDEVTERASRTMMLASLDVTALRTVGRVRIALPMDAFSENAAPKEDTSSRDAVQLRHGIANVPVTLRAEVGKTEMTLAQLANLQVGDMISIRPSAAEGLLIRLEGRPKFRAVPGSVAGRLAAQAVTRL